MTLKDRTYKHQAQPMSGVKAVTVGQGYSTIAWIPEESGSWALPLLHERITSFDNPITKAAAQLKLICQHLPQRPLSLWDAEYGCAFIDYILNKGRTLPKTLILQTYTCQIFQALSTVELTLC